MSLCWNKVLGKFIQTIPASFTDTYIIQVFHMTSGRAVSWLSLSLYHSDHTWSCTPVFHHVSPLVPSKMPHRHHHRSQLLQNYLARRELKGTQRRNYQWQTGSNIFIFFPPSQGTSHFQIYFCDIWPGVCLHMQCCKVIISEVFNLWIHFRGKTFKFLTF